MATTITTMSEGFSTNPSAAQNSAAIARDKWRTRYPDDAWKRIKHEGWFLACVPLLGALVIAILTLGKFDDHGTAKAMLICALGGITGSWMFSVRVYVHAVTHGRWRSDELVERLTTPFTGIFLAVSAYTLIKTGIMGVTFASSNTDPNLFGYGIGFLVGLFSDDVMGKLTGVVKTFFGEQADDNEARTANKSWNAEDKASVSSSERLRGRGVPISSPILRTGRRAPLHVVPVSS